MIRRYISGDHDGFVSPYGYADHPMSMSEYTASLWSGDWLDKADIAI
jgi:hypothetical protein